jgi:hypothetical protein
MLQHGCPGLIPASDQRRQAFEQEIGRATIARRRHAAGRPRDL